MTDTRTDNTSNAAGPTLLALSAATGGVHRIDPTTGRVSTLVSGLEDVPDGIAVDPVAGEIVVTLMGRPEPAPREGAEPLFTAHDGSIITIPLEGGEVKTLVPRGSFTTGKQLVREATTGRLFWSDREGRGVYRCEADGSGVTPLVLTSGTTPSAAEDECVGVAVDAEAGHLYWSQKGPSKGGHGRILRAALEIPEGTTADSREDIEVLWDGLPEPIDLELDPEAGTLIWTDRGAEPEGNSLNRAPIPAPGTRGQAPQILARGFHEAIGVAVARDRDLAFVSDLGGHVYEVDLSTGAMRRIAELAGGVTGLVLHGGV
ncbi:glutaminyl-peptide cyclotransferase [Brachybacterium sp. ACRRE]|uniref:glutaminyl-peptide cyclotransferase n=1 Tax=Brachybacterium sp. ACRRE TaxID=2918184 RepID=UPI001EF34398|nr:glutaminyl-peptide cyclotransferase [Brachybacterium sp. ACRRE]MCG7308328.1 glutaminyl-peptide cyclotransferase [Brachybacterium sp. ACRRE]